MRDRQTPVKVLNDLILQYFEIDSQLKAISAQRDTLNHSIKDLMTELKLTMHVSGNIAVTCRTQAKTSLNKEKLLQKVRDCGLPDDFLNGCWDENQFQVLTVKRIN